MILVQAKYNKTYSYLDLAPMDMPHPMLQLSEWFQDCLVIKQVEIVLKFIILNHEQKYQKKFNVKTSLTLNLNETATIIKLKLYTEELKHIFYTSEI